MFEQSKKSLIVAAVLLTLILAGCGGTAQPTTEPPVEPTIDTQPTFAQIQTQAVQTAVAEMTINAPTATEVPPPTETPVPTATEAPTEVPTAVPPTATATTVFIPWTATPTATTSAMACTITEQSPPFGYDVKPGADFDGRWVVKNVGTSTWRADAVDIKYVSVSGQHKFHTGSDIYDLERDVVTQGTYTIVIDMVAPNNDGRYSTTWALVRGGETICTLPITIDVVP